MMTNKLRTILALSILTLTSAHISAQECLTVSEVLRQVEQNNLQLKAFREEMQASVMDAKADNALGETSVEYSPFFTSGVSGLASSELIVSQEFDFPTRYAQRRKVSEKRNVANEKSYVVTLSDLMLSTKEACIDMLSAQQMHDHLQQRLLLADSLSLMMNSRKAKGDATALDINRVKLNRMELMRQLSDNEADLLKTRESLAALNGGVAINEIVADASLEMTNVLPLAEQSAEVQQARAEEDVATHEASAERKNWLPTMKLGYRKNKEGGDQFHGFLVGGSVSLFSSNHRQKAAQHRQAAAALKTEEAKHKVEGAINAQLHEIRQLEESLRAYDENLMQESLHLLYRSLQLRQIDLTTYYVEVDKIYEMQQSRFDLQSRYRKAVARLQQYCM